MYPVTAQIMFNLGNIEVVQVKRDSEVSIFMYSSTKKLQFSDQKFLDKRMNYINNSIWFRLQQWWFSFKNFMNIYILNH